MLIKIDFRNFWGNFKQQAKNAGGLKRSFIQVLNEDGYNFVLDEEKPDMIFFNSFGPITYTGNAIKIGYVTESANRFGSIFEKIKEKYFDLVIGNVPNIKSTFVKHPLYIPSCDPYTINQQYLNNLNDFVKERNIKDLKFCALINSHDQFNTRTPILRELETQLLIYRQDILNNLDLNMLIEFDKKWGLYGKPSNLIGMKLGYAYKVSRESLNLVENMNDSNIGCQIIGLFVLDMLGIETPKDFLLLLRSCFVTSIIDRY